MTQDNRDLPVSQADEEQEIDLLELASKLWDSRRRIIKWAIWGIVIGLVVAFSIPKEYTATVKLAPELGSAKSGGTGGLAALASMAGVNLSQSSGVDAVYPELYPDIVSSVPFAVGLLSVELPTNIEDTDSATVETLLMDHTSSPWWGYVLGVPGKIIGGIKSLFTDEEEEGDGTIDPNHLTLEQSQLVEAVNQRVAVNVDTKTQVVTITSTLQDPVAANALADTVTSRLKAYIKEYRTEKARADLDYARKINREAREEYYKAQSKYAAAADRNHGLSTRSAAIELERLQNETQLAFSLYNNTSQQVKVAEAKVQESTPVFAIVQPSTVPVRASKPRKVLILIGFVFLAVVAASAWILFAPGLIASFKEKKQELDKQKEEEEQEKPQE